MSIQSTGDSDSDYDVDNDAIPPEIPDCVSSAKGKLVYVYLATSSDATIDELSDHLQMKKISLFSVLNSLSSEGVIEKEDDFYNVV